MLTLVLMFGLVFLSADFACFMLGFFDGHASDPRTQVQPAY